MRHATSSTGALGSQGTVVELVDPWGLRSNAVWDAEQGKGLELGVLILLPGGWPWIGGFPPWASVFLSIK